MAANSRIKQKALWRSRRGLLELDLYLTPFAEECFDDLAKAEQFTYVQLLELEDVEILDWLKESKEPPTEFADIVENVIAFAQRLKTGG